MAERESEGSTVKANTQESLRHGEVAIRRVLVEHVAVPTLVPGLPFARPDRVTIRPPTPFAGAGVYHRRSNSVLGNLSVRFPGRTVRIGSKRSKARVGVVE